MALKERLKDYVAVALLWLMMLWEDIKEIIITVVITFLVALAVQTFFFKPVIVDGTSMYPTVNDGDVGFSSVVQKNVAGINRFDIVVVSLDSGEKEKLLIKRVIGLPGDSVEFKNDQLYINGEMMSQDFLDEEYVKNQKEISSSGLFTNDFTIVLGEDEYFCMGDNRLVSADSRVYGAFSKEKIQSIGIFVLYPFQFFGNKK